MATAQRIPLTQNAAATVAALNVAVAAVTVAPNTYLAAPIDLGDSLVITSSNLATPNSYTGLVFDHITTGNLVLSPANVAAFMTGLPASTGLRWVIPTRFGYYLVVRGQAVSTVNVYGTSLFTFYDNLNTLSSSSPAFNLGIFTTQVTPSLPVGDYRLDWNFELRTSGGAATGAADGQVTLDAAEIAIASRLSNPASSWSAFSGFFIVNFVVAAAHTIAVSVARNGGAGPPPTNAQMRRVRLAMYRIF